MFFQTDLNLELEEDPLKLDIHSMEPFLTYGTILHFEILDFGIDSLKAPEDMLDSQSKPLSLLQNKDKSKPKRSVFSNVIIKMICV